jgi:hypothetical protein
VLISILAAIEQAPLIRTVATTISLYATLSALHIFGLGAALGAIILLDVNVLRGAAQEQTALDIGARKLAIVGLILAIGTGVVLFACRATGYFNNPAFLWKLGVIGLALVNVIAFHRFFDDRALFRRASAIMSMLSWISALFLGRWIAFSGL